MNGGFNRELIPGNPFSGAPDVSGDGQLRTFAFGGNEANGIAFTADDPLYQTERWGMSGYDLGVPDGRYRVRLLVAEISPTTPRRVFDVRAEGAVVVDDFDIRATFHAFEATTLEFVVPVTDGRLDLDFSSSSNAPTVAAIEVVDARLPDERIS